MKLYVILSAVFLLFLSATTASENVPVFLWTTDRSVEFPDVYAGHSLTDQELTEDFLQRILPTVDQETADREPLTLAIFVQEQMNLRDLMKQAQVFNSSRYGAVFAHLRGIMSKTQSKFLPSVFSAFETVISLISGEAESDEQMTKGYDVIRITNPSEYPVIIRREGPQKSSKTSVVYIIYIPESASPREIDELIGKVDRELVSLGRPYSAIYTGKRSSVGSPKPRPEVLLSDYSMNQGLAGQASNAAGRKLQQNVFPTYYLFANLSNCLYFYAQNISISVLDHGSWALPLDPIYDGYCSNYSAELSLTFNNVDETLQEVNFLMIFGVTQGLNQGYWLMTNFTVSYVISNNGTVYNNTEEMYPYFITETPYSFSYLCYELPPISPLHTMDGLGTKYVNITFSGLQVQAFNITNNQFGYYNDCVGFFTITTWACLITIFIMVGILWFAACMFAGLTTHDRYEDPHGRQLVVNTVD